MVPPHGLEVTYDKTVHVIFPSEVRYVDLGSPDLIAGKADGAENVIRVKATVRNFPNETNMSVITEDGSFYTFNVKYADEPLLLNVEMCDFCLLYTSKSAPKTIQSSAAAYRDLSATWSSIADALPFSVSSSDSSEAIRSNSSSISRCV